MKRAKRRQTGDVISEARQAIRFTQDAFSSELGVSRRTLSRWEFGHTRPNEVDMQYIAIKLHQYDRAVGREAAAALETKVPAIVGHVAIAASLRTLAATLGLPEAQVNAALATSVRAWETAGATVDDVAMTLGR